MSDQLQPLTESKLDHLKFFILFGLSFLLSENLILILNRNFPAMFTPFVTVFQDLTLSVFTVVSFLFFARMISILLPEINTTKQLPLYIGIIPALIISHPLYIAISGATFTANWLLISIIENRQLFHFILEVILFAVMGIIVIMIQSRSAVKEDRYHRIFRYLGDDLYLGLFIGSVTLYLIRSFLTEGLEALTLTIPLKLVLLYLFYLITSPLGETSEKS